MAIHIEERSLELALVKAAGRLGLTQAELGYRVLSQSGGFLGFGKKVCIEAWAKDLNSDSSLEEDLRQFLLGLYVCMFGKKTDILMEKDLYGRLIFDIQCENLASQFRNSSKIAEAFEHLLRKQPREMRADLPFRIFVDAMGTRLQKEEELVNMAKTLSDKVYANQKPIVLNYQSPYDRKIIHLALDKDDRVYTKSIGIGHNRKLMILPSREMNA